MAVIRALIKKGNTLIVWINRGNGYVAVTKIYLFLEEIEIQEFTGMSKISLIALIFFFVLFEP